MPRDSSTTRTFAQMFGQQEEDSAPSFPMKEAQREMLRHAVERSQRDFPVFSRGDAVHFGGGFGPFTPACKEGCVFIFWRYLDTDSAEDILRIKNSTPSELATFPTLDCLISMFDGQGAVSFNIASSCLLLLGEE